MTVSLNRCLASPAQPSPPSSTPATAAQGCTTLFPGFVPQTTVTNAAGVFTFANLQEGVYSVTTSPATVGRASTTPKTPGAPVTDAPGNPILYTLVGNNDVETGNFVTP